MNAEDANKFINTLVKNLQVLCHGHVNFNSSIQVIGHLYLNVDSDTNIDYIVNEKVCKSDTSSTVFVSKSYHSEPKASVKPEVNQNKPVQNPPSAPIVSLKSHPLQSLSQSIHPAYREKIDDLKLCLPVSVQQPPLNNPQFSTQPDVNKIEPVQNLVSVPVVSQHKYMYHISQSDSQQQSVQNIHPAYREQTDNLNLSLPVSVEQPPSKMPRVSTTSFKMSEIFNKPATSTSQIKTEKEEDDESDLCPTQIKVEPEPGAPDEALQLADKPESQHHLIQNIQPTYREQTNDLNLKEEYLQQADNSNKPSVSLETESSFTSHHNESMTAIPVENLQTFSLVLVQPQKLPIERLPVKRLSGQPQASSSQPQLLQIQSKPSSGPQLLLPIQPKPFELTHVSERPPNMSKSGFYYHRKNIQQQKALGIVKRKYFRSSKLVVLCKLCGKDRAVGHKQHYGNWYCAETSNISEDQWRNELQKLKKYGPGPRKK